MDTTASTTRHAPPRGSTAPVDEAPPPYPGPPSMVPDGFFSVVGDVMFIGAGTRLPLGVSGVACDVCHHQEGSPRPTLGMVLFFWVTLLIVGILFTVGFALTGLAFAKCAAAAQVRQGMLCILAAGAVAVVAAAFGIIHMCRYDTPTSEL